MYLREKIGNITRYEYMNFMRYPNVVGVGRGNKYINNIDTGKLCIKIYVKEKYKKGYNATGCVPKYYFGIPTDVIETGEFIPYKGFNEKIRPAKMGYSIAALPIKRSGTAGCIVKRDNPSGNTDFFILSCNHVIADNNKLPIGTDIIQPGVIKDVGNAIAKLSEFEPIKYSTPGSRPENYIDAAIAKINDINLVRPQMAFIGIPAGAESVVFPNILIKKSGAITGYSEGKIVDDSVATEKTSPGGEKALFIDQILVEIESAPGDSGAMVLTRNNYVIGMMMSGSSITPKYVMVNKIQRILDIMKVSLYIQR